MRLTHRKTKDDPLSHPARRHREAGTMLHVKPYPKFVRRTSFQQRISTPYILPRSPLPRFISCSFPSCISITNTYASSATKDINKHTVKISIYTMYSSDLLEGRQKSSVTSLHVAPIVTSLAYFTVRLAFAYATFLPVSIDLCGDVMWEQKDYWMPLMYGAGS
jgi:hypothetical protein